MSRNGSRIDAMHATRSITSTVPYGGLSTSTIGACGRVGQNDTVQWAAGVDFPSERARFRRSTATACSLFFFTQRHGGTSVLEIPSSTATPAFNPRTDPAEK